MDKTHVKPTKQCRKRRSSKEEKDSSLTLTKEELRNKLRDKLHLKQTSRLSRHARDTMAETIETRLENAKGKEEIKLKRQLHQLEDIEEKEILNENKRTIPDY